VIAEICDSVIIPVEMGGGISNISEALEALSLGVYRLVIGTLIHENEKEFIKIFEKVGPKKISAAIDVIDNEVDVALSPESNVLGAMNRNQLKAECFEDRLEDARLRGGKLHEFKAIKAHWIVKHGSSISVSSLAGVIVEVGLKMSLLFWLKMR